MAIPRFSASDEINAPPAVVYGILADYREKHPRILPKPPFVSLVVEAGGVGEGTVFLAEMSVLGKVQSFRGTVAEPQPGRVLVETTDTGYVTTFTIDPGNAPGKSQVTIATEMPGRSGMMGTLEAWMARRLLVPAYRRELQLLDRLASKP